MAGSTDGVVRVWDLAALARTDALLTIRTGHVPALATAVVDGQPVAVTGHAEGVVRRWDLVTGREFRAGGDGAEDSGPLADPPSDLPRPRRAAVTTPVTTTVTTGSAAASPWRSTP
ncbi:hypothetical protein ACFQ1I_40370 [Kitasatospora arboriphila]